MTDYTNVAHSEWLAWQEVVKAWPTFRLTGRNEDINDRGNTLVKRITLWGEYFALTKIRFSEEVFLGLGESKRAVCDDFHNTSSLNSGGFIALIEKWADVLVELRRTQEPAVWENAMRIAKDGLQRALALHQ